MFLLFVVAVLGASEPPVEVVIDCSTWDGRVETTLAVRFETRAGEVLTDVFILPDGTDPSNPRGGFRILFAANGWRFEYAGADRYLVVVRGSADSPIRSASFKSTGWVPPHLVRPAPPWVPRAPAPREVRR